MLASAPPMGTGLTGATELETFFGLACSTSTSSSRSTSTAIRRWSSYATVLDRYAARPAAKRIWVTETGSSNPENQIIAWVQDFYPRVANVVHPEMICWYALWGGGRRIC
ncbi:MAG: hypothetical protein U0Q11_16580 [Vicinamibacterales bacterium]